MSPLGNCLSVITLAACIYPTFIFASPLAASEDHANGLSRRSNRYNIPCGNAPNIKAGNKPSQTDINPPSQDDGPPTATTDKSGYFPYVWCLADTYTYVFIDPTGAYGFNNGTNEPIFATGLEGAWNSTQIAMKQQSNLAKPVGEARVDDAGMTVQIPIQNIPEFSTTTQVQLFARNANHQQLTYGSYAAALTIIRDFITRYTLYADTMYFQISEGKYGTVGNGYMGLVNQSPTGTQNCSLKPQVSCGMPGDYPDN